MAVIDLQTLNEGTVLEADICVVGAGAAGIALARHFVGTGLRVLLLEAGGWGYSPESQALYEGEFGTLYRGDEYEQNYLSIGRLRYFGGSTNHWAGWCRALDPMDFEARSWVEHSGWPVSWEEFEPWLQPAGELLLVKPQQDPKLWSDSVERPLLPFDRHRLLTRIYTFSSPVRMGDEYGDELFDSDEVDVAIDANVTDIVSGQELHLRTLAGKAFEVQTRFTVLAAGGIENPRLLMANGIGGDACGRFFADHPHLNPSGAVLLTGRQLEDLDLYSSRTDDPIAGCKAMGLLSLPDTLKRDEGLLDAVLMLRELGEEEPEETAASVASIAGELQPGGVVLGEAFIVSEMAPNPESRITLTQENDAIGLPKVRLDWKLRDRDAQSMRRTLQLMGSALGADGWGRMQITATPDDPWQRLRGGHHHMGTTRMADSVADGVVDRDCQVFGVPGLYIAGSSVFSTSGACNPTLSLVALALRLADHLQEQL